MANRDRQKGNVIRNYLTKLVLTVIMTGCMVMLHPQEVQAANASVWVNPESSNIMITNTLLPANTETKYYTETGAATTDADAAVWSIKNDNDVYTMTLLKSLQYSRLLDASPVLKFTGKWVLNLGGNTLTIETKATGIQSAYGELKIANGTLNLNGVPGLSRVRSGLLVCTGEYKVVIDAATVNMFNNTESANVYMLFSTTGKATVSIENGGALTMENGTDKSRNFLLDVQLDVNGTLFSKEEVNSHKAERWVNGNTGTKSETTAKENVTSHNHDYQWVLVKEATVEEDGEEEYRCTSCGDVKARNKISANMFYVKEFNRLIIEAD